MRYGDEALARVRALLPALAERAQATEDARRPPDETIADLAGTGVLDLLVPERFGGAELPLGVLVDACREIGAACGSTGWLTTIYAMHNWMLGLFPEEAQREVWKDRPYGFMPCALSPGGTAEAVDGGHRLNGRWSWGSGVMHADHVMVMGLVTVEETLEPRVFLLPREDVEVHDVWHTSGMRGTGSNDIEVSDRFVPAHRSVALQDLTEGRSPGSEVHTGALYRLPLVPVFVLTAAAPVLGIAEGVLAGFTERMQGRVMAYTGVRQRNLMSGQIRLAKATAELAAARLLLEDEVERLTRTYTEGGSYDMTQRANSRLVAAHVTAVARTVVNELCAVSGASVQFTHSPFQRAQRDVNTISGHVVFDMDATYALYGKVSLGITPDAMTLV